ncbi:hypothetical protein CNECB9_2850003 [Cupriavidus necator]|uniref:Integrase n=1 Tax=Cupriavidus necator TaxID=106590 RepID=A0A1K0IFQ7_CUPNE|nr:hypothetical protein CNECB9_2850003 [Cupriavidus necator]
MLTNCDYYFWQKARNERRAAGKPLSSLTHEDLLVYERFLTDPQPAARWVLAGSKKLARSHPEWRPLCRAIVASQRAPRDGDPECALRLAD